VLLLQGNQTGWVSGVVSPGAATGVDTVAFVLEGDAVRAGNSAGGLLEEDRTGSPAAAAVDASAPTVEVPVNAGPESSRNAAAVAAPGGGWRAALGACAAAWALLALGRA
jgi:hypothetical protein